MSHANAILVDLTGDRLPDILTGNRQGGRIGLLTNDGTGIMRAGTAAGPYAGAAVRGNDTDPVLVSVDLNRVLSSFALKEEEKKGKAVAGDDGEPVGDVCRLHAGIMDVLRFVCKQSALRFGRKMAGKRSAK